MSPITLLPRGPTLGTMPGAVALALMTTEIRLAAALGRTLPFALPAVLHRHAITLMEALLLVELIVLVLRLAMLVFEYLLMETMRVSTTPEGALLLGAAFLGASHAGLGPVAAGLAAFATLATSATIAWVAQNMRTRPEAVPDYRPCHGKN